MTDKTTELVEAATDRLALCFPDAPADAIENGVQAVVEAITDALATKPPHLDPYTVEACAKVAEATYLGHGRLFGTPKAFAYEHAGRRIATALRALIGTGEGRDG